MLGHFVPAQQLHHGCRCRGVRHSCFSARCIPKHFPNECYSWASRTTWCATAAASRAWRTSGPTLSRPLAGAPPEALLSGPGVGRLRLPARITRPPTTCLCSALSTQSVLYYPSRSCHCQPASAYRWSATHSSCHIVCPNPVMDVSQACVIAGRCVPAHQLLPLCPPAAAI